MFTGTTSRANEHQWTKLSTEKRKTQQRSTVSQKTSQHKAHNREPNLLNNLYRSVVTWIRKKIYYYLVTHTVNRLCNTAGCRLNRIHVDIIRISELSFANCIRVTVARCTKGAPPLNTFTRTVNDDSRSTSDDWMANSRDIIDAGLPAHSWRCFLSAPAQT